LNKKAMPEPLDPREEAMRRLNERAAALDARTRPPEVAEHGHQAAAQGFRLMALLLGGVLAGTGLGFVVDGVLKTAPLGIIAGTLVGFAVSVFTAVRSAKAMSAQAAREWGPPRDLPFDEDDDD
jgi:ATP synthase protein I